MKESKIREIIKDLRKYKSLENKKHNASYYYNTKQAIMNSDNVSQELREEFLDVYNECLRRKSNIETDDKAITEIERDENGLIQYYTFEIFRKDAPTLRGKLSREEMETIYRLYSYYGANLTQKIVSREFPYYTFIEFKRILRAFNIYKASSEFPPHFVEEKSEEELLDLHNLWKENNVLRKIEKDQLAETTKLLQKYARENVELKNTLNSLNSLNIKIENFVATPKSETYNVISDQSIMLHLSDLHIGSKCNSYTLYPNPWNKTELTKRLNSILSRLSQYGEFNNIVLNLLGDMLDGMDNQTARRDHFMPQNMDNMEQIETFIQVMIPFIDKLNQICDHLIIYSVRCGNHDGDFGYAATLALQNIIKRLYPDVSFTLFKEFIGSYEFNGHRYLICHGKDSQFMKKPLPLVLNEQTKVMIYEWLESKHIPFDFPIHFIKGDLHSEGVSNCNLFDYRNVLSLYGASDYSNFNYSRNPYGISYDYFVGDVRTIGTFENL